MKYLSGISRFLPKYFRKSILDVYARSSPDPQNALDIFKGEWASQLPPPFAELKAGNIALFDDIRIKWLEEQIGGFHNKTILELGPLEGGHSYMLEKRGATSIIAIEANTRAYLKCLIVKEIFDLQKVHFLCGDFMEYLRNDGPDFDVIVASGVLYHMQNPVELIARAAKRCKQHLLIWTHYYDEAIISTYRKLAAKFKGSAIREYEGFQHTLYRQEYGTALNFTGFCGGNAATSQWMSLADIHRCLEHFGFSDVRTNFHQTVHSHGPSIALIAKRN